ncbi:hypothetical protein DFQ28_005005 [Apophysomyces sp. BC1034]|nr:hypothetical protein DFQ30_000577 [Apophysomyces sp. BC1015]KAG0180307.1 hypothetical protein DFQ29_000926 [Apophysomyces sp. BC1021]KAG0194793.1 hypothetical protein DFQ28_005005 [Apophysomyces sp. BC1034]
MAQGYSSLPQDVEGSSRAAGNDGSLLDRARNWWNGSSSENAPLINKQKMTLEPPRTSTRKTIITVALIFLGFIALGAITSFWINNDNGEGVAPPLVGRKPTAAEKLMLEMPSTDRLRENLRKYTSEAHLAGTEGDKRTADWTKEKLIEFGLANTTIETYWPLLNYPEERRLAIISGPENLRYEASLTEDVVDEDESSKDPNIVPTFHGYSKNGTATGPVVYANYGRREDFQFLVDRGINLTGTIALVRYGGTFRGIKVKAASDFGCIGALVYSDPIDDGPLNKDGYPYNNPAESYPDGPWRSPSSAQRGSVSQLQLSTGDPLTPGWAATENATRIPQEDVNSLVTIPSLPLSWKDALPLLKATQNHGVRGEHDWAGGLKEVDYYSGPSEGLVELVNKVEYKITPIWDVISTIKGTEEPERAIILGNHRDAWVYGAVDPSSGSATLLEIGRVLGELLKTGWRPKRTIILASWDAEEYALIGSTEWGEDHRDWLSQTGTVYINVDVAVSGPNFEASASPSLNRLLYEVARVVPDPNSGRSVYDAWAELTNRTSEPAAQPEIGPLGSGSDFVVFLDHIGIASMNLVFSGDYGVYHSNYDSFHWMEKFGDPNFEYHRTMVRIWGLLALRLAEDEILPIYPLDYARKLEEYVEGLNAYVQPYTFPSLHRAIRKLVKAAENFEIHVDGLQHKGRESEIARVNKRLAFFERGLLDPKGLSGRTWFKHVVYAPGLWTGYSSQVFPGIAEALDSKDFELARYAEGRAIKSIKGATAILNIK